MRHVVLAVGLMVVAGSGGAVAPTADELGRVFFDAQGRLAMSAERRLALSGSVATEEVPLAQAPQPLVQQPELIALDAVLIGARKAVWINRQLVEQVIEVAGVRIDPAQATADGLWLGTPQGRRLLKQGQVYLPTSGKVVERYEVM